MAWEDMYEEQTPPPEELFAWEKDWSQQEALAQQREYECFQSWKRRRFPGLCVNSGQQVPMPWGWE